MALTKYLSGKSGERYEFSFHGVGRELAGGPGIFALFPVTTSEAVAASVIYGDGAQKLGDDRGLPIHLGASDDLARDLGPSFTRGVAFGEWQATEAVAVYFWRANSKVGRDAALLDLWGAYPAAHSTSN